MTAMIGWVIFLIYIQTLNAVFQEKDNILEKIDNLRGDMSTFSSTINDMEEEVSQRIAYECNNGLQSDICSTDGFSDSKRSVKWADPDSATDYNTMDIPLRKLMDYVQKREALRHLQNVLNTADIVLRQERKRSCNLNLGFHCSSGDILKMAHDYNWVKSDYSPGKKKRAA